MRLPYAEGAEGEMRPMMHNHWTERILRELNRLESVAERGFREPVHLFALYERMLGDARSDVAVQWDAAIQYLRKQGLIVVDQAGYVVLTPNGRAEVPVIVQRLQRKNAG